MVPLNEEFSVDNYLSGEDEEPVDIDDEEEEPVHVDVDDVPMEELFNRQRERDWVGLLKKEIKIFFFITKF